MKTNFVKSGITVLAATAVMGGVSQAQSTRIHLDGQPLRTSVSPITQNGRVLVPLRDIFEALGASVNYNDSNRTILAERGETEVSMRLGSRQARVNGRNVRLDVPADTVAGRTMVPLRFVSEALGAQVNYNSNRYLVDIRSSGTRGVGGNWNGNRPGNWGGSQVGSSRQISIPANAVVPVRMDQTLSSADARVGQSFTATVESSQPGDSEFPAGTRLEGQVVQVTRRDNNTPGVLDLRFRNAILPDGSRVTVNGVLTSLESDAVNQSDGRIVAKDTKNNDTLKVVGIGAAAGFVLGRVLKKDGALPTVLGALGGLLYDKTKNNNKTAEARVESGTRLGVRLTSPVTYRDTTGYYQQRSNYIRL